MLIRRERPADIDAIRAVTTAAFNRPGLDGEPVETGLLEELRADPGWLPGLSFVAQADTGEVVGHVVCTRGQVGPVPALGLGPLSVVPGHQRAGVGSALMHAVLGAADALDEPLVALLGEPAYYGRFGFRPAREEGVIAPDPAWGDYFQVRLLTAHTPRARGAFGYAEPFTRL
ncbi:putative acetyltransferase [Marinactinospora thermotolerans DSM 45154]|uniref:Acetyltransferase n=2 Tax=Marinactinospora thermotolerans TaxID=531310 RepID=I7E706_9ACTN|nr:N-acetyltransferase [Marinactinospora thermotolerans]AFO85458.1 Acetyltransferase [Marinactinospora thermotolerans]SKA23646.1 putative acetyltransferase [Marinactinospora thermotolerans DSM 45154]